MSSDKLYILIHDTFDEHVLTVHYLFCNSCNDSWGFWVLEVLKWVFRLLNYRIIRNDHSFHRIWMIKVSVDRTKTRPCWVSLGPLVPYWLNFTGYSKIEMLVFCIQVASFWIQSSQPAHFKNIPLYPNQNLFLIKFIVFLRPRAAQ